MKKLLLPIFVLLTGYIQAQVCVPGTLTSTAKGYILPDSATNMVHGCPGLDYTQIMYIKAPKDTAFSVTLAGQTGVITADVDSFVIDRNITGLPTYLSTASVPNYLPAAGASFPKSNFERLVVKGDSLACVKISGTVPSATAAGTNNLGISVRAYLKNLASTNLVLNALLPTLFPGNKIDTVVNINYYKIIIDPQPCFPQSVTNLSTYGFNVIGNIPNPFTQQTQIKFESTSRANYELSVMNSVGQVVFKKTINATEGLNYYTLDASNWRSGMYSYSLSNGQKVLTAKMQIQ